MCTVKPVTVGPCPAASTEGETTLLYLEDEAIELVGDLEYRRRAAQALAEAVGLSVVDTSRIPTRTTLAGALAGGDHLATRPWERPPPAVI